MKPVEILNVQSHPNSQTFLMKERQMVETDLTSALAGQAATGCRATPEEGLPQPLQKLLIAQALADTAGPARRHSAIENQFLQISKLTEQLISFACIKYLF